MKRRFEVKEEHLKLLRHMNVGWQDCEFGAPEIDPKRPYGNSGDLVLKDIHYILTSERVGRMDSRRYELTKAETERYSHLHMETEAALQIALATGKFEVGTYECEQYGRDWYKVN